MKLFVILIAGGFALASCTTRSPAIVAAPERPTKSQAFIAAAHPLAVEAGENVLRAGGGAVDAAVAVQAMLSLVEPQSSGLGGGAFMVRYDAATGAVTVYDGRETAPRDAMPDMFLDAQGKSLPFRTAVLSGRATGVPGVVAMLGMAHDRHGRIGWNRLFDDVIRVADEGFVVTKRLERFVHGNAAQAGAHDVVAYFRNAKGEKIRAGDRLRNPTYAAFVRRLATEGPKAMYAGETPRRIVARVRQGALPGMLSETDFAQYRPVVREALCNPFRLYILCVPPPPSSGVGLLQLMALIERTDIGTRGPNDPVAWVKYAEASRVMYADRDAYVGDTSTVPIHGMLDPAYIKARATLIGSRAGEAPKAGKPFGAPAVSVDFTNEAAGTSHFIVIDRDGNAVSMTTTVESYFGSGRMVDGFFLNNQMTDFSFLPTGPNRIVPGKRPRSSMAPTIILGQDRQLVGAIGSPGGNAILGYVSKALTGALEWNLSMSAAIALPNLIGRGENFNGEADRFPAAMRREMRARGVDIQPGSGEDSGLHGVLIRDGRFEGGADPRRDGVARTIYLSGE